jgi:hypothetical protein
MYTSLNEILQAVISMRAGEHKQGRRTTSDKRFIRAINLALQRFAKDVPSALVPSEQTVHLIADQAPSDVTIKATAEPQVFKFFKSGGLTDWLPVMDGSWDGVMWLAYQIGDRVHMHRGLKYYSITNLGVTEYYVSIDPPTSLGILTLPRKFVLFQKHFFIPSGAISVDTELVLRHDTESTIMAITDKAAISQNYTDVWFNRQSSVPLYFWRSDMINIPAPTRKPDIDVSEQDPWVGPYQEGSFKFCYTYVRGLESEDSGQTNLLLRKPVLESAPSPYSNLFDHSLLSNPGKKIIISTAEVEEMLDFATSGDLRDRASGIRIRIYAARHTVRTVGLGSINMVDADQRMYLLGELSDSKAGIPSGTFEWDGSFPYDQHFPLRNSTGYYGYSLWPRPSTDMTLIVKYLRAPIDLVHDQDTPSIHAPGVDAFIELCMHYVARVDGNDLESSQLYLSNYNRLKQDYISVYGSSDAAIKPRSLASSGRVNRTSTFREV